jgi:hypothetical protein
VSNTNSADVLDCSRFYCDDGCYLEAMSNGICDESCSSAMCDYDNEDCGLCPLHCVERADDGVCDLSCHSSTNSSCLGEANDC